MEQDIGSNVADVRVHLGSFPTMCIVQSAIIRLTELMASIRTSQEGPGKLAADTGSSRPYRILEPDCDSLGYVNIRL